jgi:hypothetical protein
MTSFRFANKARIAQYASPESYQSQVEGHPTIIISLQHFLRMPFERLPGSIHIGKLPGYVLPRPNSPNTKQVPSSKLDRKNCE